MKAKLTRRQNKYDAVIKSPIGRLGIIITNGRITKIGFITAKIGLVSPADKIGNQIIEKFKQYFSDPNVRTNFPVTLQGTSWQKKIWRKLQKIPLGKTITYGKLAEKIGTNPRVVGNACRRNPIPIIVPCHCVIAASGIGGYCGKPTSSMLRIKNWLLRHERKYSVNIKKYVTG